MSTKKNYENIISECFIIYKKAGGIHSSAEYSRFIDIFIGILKGNRIIADITDCKDINFSKLITEDESFKYWVDYVGSIKESKIYIKSIYNFLQNILWGK